MSYTNISHLGTAQSEWIRALDFYVQDLSILSKRLLEIAGKNTSKEAAEGIGHFQNQFWIQRRNIRTLKHRIQANGHLAAQDAREHAGRVNELVIDNKDSISEDMTSFEKTIKGLREEFNEFLSKWM